MTPPRRPTRPPALTAEDIEAIHAMIAEAAERRVWARVGKWVGRGLWPVALFVMGWVLNHYSIQRNEETRHMGRQETAKVEAKLQEVEKVTKALAPEAFTSSKAAK